MKYSVILLGAALLACPTDAKRDYQPSERVLNKMMDIELERYQNKFRHPSDPSYHHYGTQAPATETATAVPAQEEFVALSQ